MCAGRTGDPPSGFAAEDYPTAAFGVTVTCKSSTTQYPAMKLVAGNDTIQRWDNTGNQGTVLMTVTLNSLLYRYWKFSFYWHKFMENSWMLTMKTKKKSFIIQSRSCNSSNIRIGCSHQQCQALWPQINKYAWNDTPIPKNWQFEKVYPLIYKGGKSVKQLLKIPELLVSQFRTNIKHQCLSEIQAGLPGLIEKLRNGWLLKNQKNKESDKQRKWIFRTTWML